MGQNEDGTYHYYDSRMISKKEEDTVTAILGTQKDITQEILNNKILNDTIEKLRFAIQTAGMAMWEYNCDTQLFTTYNEPVADYKDGAVISMSTYDCYSQKDDENLELIEKAAGIVKDRKDESYNFIVKMKTKYDSDWQYCTVRGVPMEKDKNGTVIKYLGVRLNITEQINYQKFLEREKETAQQADKLKSAFLANMSHEIRTPLNSIVGFSDLLKDIEAFSPEEVKQFVDTINTNCTLLLALINDILDLSRIESGSMDFRFAGYNLTFVMQQIYDSQRLSMPRGVELVMKLPEGEGKSIVTDSVRLKQVINNFINNAKKFTTQGSITFGFQTEEPGYTVFFVEDTGSGISEENQRRIFERFYKVDSFTQGAGLGLSICQTIVERFRGEINVSSELGKGTRFTVRVPDFNE